MGDYYDSYEDWYDNGPGSVAFNTRCRESSVNAQSKLLERHWKNEKKAKKYDKLIAIVADFLEYVIDDDEFRKRIDELEGE